MCHAHAVLFMATTKSSPFSRPDPRHALALENVVYVYFARAVQAKFSVIEAYFVIVGYLKSTSRKMDIWVLAFGPGLVKSVHNISFLVFHKITRQDNREVEFPAPGDVNVSAFPRVVF